MLFKNPVKNMHKNEHRKGCLYCLIFACIMAAQLHLCGCSQLQVRSTLHEANGFFSQGNYEASLRKYEQIMEEYPSEGDRVLFEMGIIYAYPKNERKDYLRSLECFEELVKNYPESNYRYESERMIFHINNITVKEKRLAEQQTLIETLKQEVKSRESEIATLHIKIEELERKVFSVEKGTADKIVIEKKERRLTLLSKGEVLKAYRIALGGNPDGPKERQGDNKTPEGVYFIDSRNKDSSYHMSLHISYPNKSDRKRARKLGVSPGGNIMIHGIKNGFSMVGEMHAEFDWTKGCIAVTDEEIEEIERLVPNGTIVEIRP